MAPATDVELDPIRHGVIPLMTALTFLPHPRGAFSTFSRPKPGPSCIEAMRQTGEAMNAKFKETSLGGLAVNLPEC